MSLLTLQRGVHWNTVYRRYARQIALNPAMAPTLQENWREYWVLHGRQPMTGRMGEARFRGGDSRNWLIRVGSSWDWLLVGSGSMYHTERSHGRVRNFDVKKINHRYLSLFPAELSLAESARLHRVSQMTIHKWQQGI